VLRFVPQAALALLAPIHSVAFVTRNHALLVCDTLYGWDAALKARPQMAEGPPLVEEDGKRATITLREGLRFHDGEPVRAKDCVASIRCWATRDAFAQALSAATEERAAADDRRVVFRFKQPFPLLPDALAKVGTHRRVMMPERHALPPLPQGGAGDHRQRPLPLHRQRARAGQPQCLRAQPGLPPAAGGGELSERRQGGAFRTGGVADHPDGATASAALQRGEVGWWGQPPIDLVGALKKARGLRIDILDPNGSVGSLRFSCLHPPFDDPAIRRAILRGANQADAMTAAAGDDRTYWRVPYGFVAPGSVMASDIGMEALRHPLDVAGMKRALCAAGTVLLADDDARGTRRHAEGRGVVLRHPAGVRRRAGRLNRRSAQKRQA
jgi:peptide/nickel transport system substrate-binding protein